MLYDIPSRTQVVTAPETIRDMVDDGIIIGMKACNPDINHFNHVAAMVANRIGLMSGEDTHFPVHMALGASGGVLATRSEERRVGQECCSPCRSRWLTSTYKKKRKK